MNTVVLTGLSKRQCLIAERLWTCGSQRELDTLLRSGGHEYVAMRDLMLVAAMDPVDTVDDANKVLDKFRL